MIKLIGFKKRSVISFTRQVAGLAIISAVITLIAGEDKRMKKHEIKKKVELLIHAKNVRGHGLV